MVNIEFGFDTDDGFDLDDSEFRMSPLIVRSMAMRKRKSIVVMGISCWACVLKIGGLIANISYSNNYSLFSLD